MHCGAHGTMLTAVGEMTGLAKEVRAAVDKLCTRVETHIDLEGHPVMRQRVATLEVNQAKHLAVLEAVSDTTKANCGAIKGVCDEMAAQKDLKLVQLDRSTKVLIAAIALIGPLLTVATTIYLSHQAAAAAVVSAAAGQ